MSTLYVGRGNARPARRAGSDWLLLSAASFGALLGAIAVGALLPIDPLLAVLPTAPVILMILAANPTVRLIVVVLGGMLVFQSSQQLDAWKLGYLGLFVSALMLSFPGFWRVLRSNARSVRGIIVGSACFGTVIVLSSVVTVSNGDSLTLWLRGAAPYLLFATMPVIAVDAAECISKTILVILLIVAGAIGSVAYVVEWAGDRRDLAQFALGHIGIASNLLPGALFALALSYGLLAKRFRLFWAAGAGLVLMAMLTTGSRANLVLLAALPAVYFAAGGRTPRRVTRFISLSAAAIGLAGVGLGAVLIRPGFAGSVLTHRLVSVATILSNPTADASFRARAAETAAALRDWLAAPLLGTGPAHLVVWAAPGTFGDQLSIDSPLLFPMRFGWLGVAMLGVVVFVWLAFVRKTKDPIARATLAGTWAIALGWSLIGSALDDKGFAFSLMLELAIALAPERPHVASELHGRLSRSTRPFTPLPIGARSLPRASLAGASRLKRPR